MPGKGNAPRLLNKNRCGSLKMILPFLGIGAAVKVPMLVALLVVAMLSGLAFIFLVM